MTRAKKKSFGGRGQGADLLVDGHVVAQSGKLALEPDPSAIVGRRIDRIPRGAALRAGVVVVVRVVPGAMVKPARRGIDKPCAVQLADALCQSDLGVRLRDQLSPAFVVDNLRVFS